MRFCCSQLSPRSHSRSLCTCQVWTTFNRLISSQLPAGWTLLQPLYFITLLFNNIFFFFIVWELANIILKVFQIWFCIRFFSGKKYLATRRIFNLFYFIYWELTATLLAIFCKITLFAYQKSLIRTFHTKFLTT